MYQIGWLFFIRCTPIPKHQNYTKEDLSNADLDNADFHSLAQADQRQAKKRVSRDAPSKEHLFPSIRLFLAMKSHTLTCKNANQENAEKS